MLTYLLYAPLNIICMLICYITNPIVCLFADERGELHGFWKYWQTWDDSLDSAFFVKNKAPKFLCYDFDKHYEQYWNTTPELKRLGQYRFFNKVKDPHFTKKEKIQRYLCRVLWLTRNCGYGFAFYLFGRYTIGTQCKRETYKIIDKEHCKKYVVDKHQNVLTRPWAYKNTLKFAKHLRWEIYLGWKIREDVSEMRQYMIAHRIAFRFEK